MNVQSDKLLILLPFDYILTKVTTSSKVSKMGVSRIVGAGVCSSTLRVGTEGQRLLGFGGVMLCLGQSSHSVLAHKPL